MVVCLENMEVLIMHVEFKSKLVEILTAHHFIKGAEPYTEALGEILQEASLTTGTTYIMYKKKIFYPEMVFDIQKLYQPDSNIAPLPLHLVDQMDEFITELEAFDSNRKKYYSFMRKIVNACKSIADIRQLLPQKYWFALEDTKNYFCDDEDYPLLSETMVLNFKKNNALSYAFLNEQAIWDAMGL